MEPKEIFYDCYFKWHQENDLCAVTRTDSEEYKTIINMGTAAVPFIKEVLDKKDDTIVYTLDEIFPGVIITEGSVSFKEYCESWRKILNEIC